MAGDKAATLNAYSKAAKAGDAAAAVKFAEMIVNDDLKLAVSTLRKARSKSSTEEMNVARALLMYSEWAMRVQRGLAPHHAESAADMGFRYAVHEYKRYQTAVEQAEVKTTDVIYLYFLDGGTDRRAYQMAKKGHVAGSVDFDIAPVDGGADGAPSAPVIWLGCDRNYLKFAEPFMASLRSHGPCDIVLHVFEDHPLGPKFYHAERFVKLAEWMDENDRPVWIMDVDAIANRPPVELFPMLHGHDVAMRARPGRLEPWNQYNASVVGFNNTRGGKSYLRTIAAFLKRAAAREELAWGVDQVALLCCLRACNPSMAFLGRRAVNYDYTSDGIIWCDSGGSKWDHLDPEYQDPRYQPYLDAFRRFSGDASGA